MDNRISTDLHDIKKQLEKCLPEINHEEQIYDLLCALDRIPLTPKLIKETKLGNVVSSIRGKFKESDPKISEKAISLLSSWKKLVEASMSEKRHVVAESGDQEKHDKHEKHERHERHEKHEKKVIHEKPTTANFVQPSSTPSSNFGAAKLDQLAVNETISRLPASRKIVFNIFLNTLKPSCAADLASSVALRIEEALFEQFQSDLRGYTNKAKSLSFNLKKNEPLRSNVIYGVMTVATLLTLSAADLASHEQKVERERLQAELVDSHRSDWLEAHKTELQQDIGIDPNNKWDFDNGEDGNNSEPDVEGD